MNQGSKSEPSLKARLQRAKRAAILEAAEAELAARGLHGVRMDDVAAAAGVSVGTLYNHVGNRGALLSELLSARHAELVATLDALLARRPRPPFAEALGAFVGLVLDHFEKHLTLVRAALQEESTPRAGARKKALLEALTERAGTLLARGLAQRALRPDASGLRATLLVGMLRGVVLRAVGGELDLAAARDAVVSQFLHGAAA